MNALDMYFSHVGLHVRCCEATRAFGRRRAQLGLTPTIESQTARYSARNTGPWGRGGGGEREFQSQGKGELEGEGKIKRVRERERKRKSVWQSARVRCRASSVCTCLAEPPPPTHPHTLARSARAHTLECAHTCAHSNTHAPPKTET